MNDAFLKAGLMASLLREGGAGFRQTPNGG
jgi:hypothetical protein